MSRPARLALCAAVALLLHGCAASQSYPRPLKEITRSADYPPEVAGLTRGRGYELSSEQPDLAVDYSLCQFDSASYVEIAATIHISNAGGTVGSVRARFEAAKNRIEQSRLGGELLDERSLILTKHGKKYFALKAAYRTEGYSICIVGPILGPPQPRYVELIVWRHEDRIISLKGHARLDNRDIAAAKNLELLDAVNWTVLPV